MAADSLKIVILNVVVTLVDFVLFPVYYVFYNKPWKRPNTPRQIVRPHEFIYRDTTEVLLKPSLPEPTCGNKEIMEKEALNTMDKVFDFCVKKYKDQPCLGSRKIIGTRRHVTENDKILKKLILEEDYHWQSYNEVSTRVSHVAKGLASIGLKATDKVLIYADTCVEWLITALACFKSSIVIGKRHKTRLFLS